MNNISIMGSCKECKNEFQISHNILPRRTKFCSKNCSDIYYRLLYKRKTEIKKSISIQCGWCKKLCLPIKRYRYCSEYCMEMANGLLKCSINKREIIKKKYYNFYKCYYYDRDNFDGNRLWCLIRDDFRCVKCGNLSNLTIHHIDGNGFNLPPTKRNNLIDNLQTLCIKCHKSSDSEDIKVENYVNTPKLKNILRLD